jgi:UPF0755 protein
LNRAERNSGVNAAGNMDQPSFFPFVEATLKKVLAAAAVLVFGVFCILSAVGLELAGYAHQPADVQGRQQVVSIGAGQGLAAIAASLAGRGIVREPIKFRLLARVKGLDRRIQAGEYDLSGAMTPLAVLDTLVQGRVRLQRVTVAEGLTIAQIAALLESAGLVRAEAFRAAATDPNTLKAAGIDAPSFEGYLFPETYFFSGHATAGDIVTAMVVRFRQVFKPDWQRRAARMGWTVHQVVTLASIIEKETGAAAERARISAVFHNRLKRGMRLETDPTVIYGIPNFDGNLTRKHLSTQTPYNTYLIDGLPPGPIANPGAAAIEAALFPADSDDLYFVSRNDGTHQFSATYADHLRAVRKYQIRK